MAISLPDAEVRGGHLRNLGPAALCAVSVGLIARSAGGWWPTTWGWAALGLLLAAAAALLLQPTISLGRLDLALLAGLGSLTVWTGLSWLWSESPPQAILELERTTLYLAGVSAFLFVARRRSFASTLGGLLAVDVVLCGHALATRLVPDLVGQPSSPFGFRLTGVFLYPNALGVVAVIGLLLALGFVVDSSNVASRACAAAATVPLALALYFSNSRGAWVSLAVGLAAGFGFVARRKHAAAAFAPLAAVAALAIWLASRSRPLTLWSDPLAATHDGHRLAFAAFALAVAAASVAARRTPRTAVVALVAALAAIAIAPSSPTRLALAPGSPPPGTTPAGRFFSTTTNSRTEYWRVAVDDFLRHPIAGSGAGTFVREWYEHRRIRVDVRDAHSLYLETLAELGVAGLALLLFVLAIPVVAVWRLRGRPFLAGALAAYVAFAAHAAVDWDWELPAVTFAGLFCGASLVVAARGEGESLALDRRWWSPLLAPVLALLAFSFVGLVGNRAVAAAHAAAVKGDWQTAGAEAQQASEWAPWSAEALELKADAATARNDLVSSRTLLLRAVRKDPDDFELWSRLAGVTAGNERRHALDQAARLNPLG